MRYDEKYANTWALVIGINDYEHVGPLTYATNDATAVAEMLRTRFSFPPANVTVLLDRDATYAAIRRKFMSYTDAATIGADDRIFVFFAGHGHTVSGNRGEVGLLVPSDGNVADLASLIRWDELTRNAELFPAKHVLFVMDACYGGLALQRSPSFGSMRFMGDMLQRYARQVLTAGKADETVADGDGVRPGHSLFTAHLLDGLEGGAATRDGIITGSGVMAYVYERVSRDPYSHQTPHYGFLQGDGDFIFDTAVLDAVRAESPEASREAGSEPADLLVNAAPAMEEARVQVSTAADRVKDWLPDPTKRIKLYDSVSLQVRRFLDATDLRSFPLDAATPTAEDLAERLQLYEQVTRDLQEVVIVLATWGEKPQLSLLQNIFVRLSETDRGASGLTVWVKMAWYPVIYLAYSAGIASLAAGNYDALAAMLHAPIVSERRQREEAFVEFLVHRAADLHEYFKQLKGHERHFVPRSEYLFKALQPTLEDMLMLGRRYEALFDRFEVLLATEYVDRTRGEWAPLGRFGWKHASGDQSPLTATTDEAKKPGDNFGPLRGGLSEGKVERFLADAAAVQKFIGRVGWM